VDTLRFTTAVEAALVAGARVYPYRWKDESLEGFAASIGGHVADGRAPLGLSLCPASLGRLAPGDTVVLPSPNGAACSLVAAGHGAMVVASCLRNVSAVASWLNRARGPVAVVACGEIWPDGSLRPSLEDLLGAAALIRALDGSRSPEAEVTAGAWAGARSQLRRLLVACASGIELEAKGHGADVGYAATLDASQVVPVLADGSYFDARHAT